MYEENEIYGQGLTRLCQISEIKLSNYEFDKKKDLIALLKEKTNFIEVNTNRTLDLVKEEVIVKVKPIIYLVNSAEKSLKIKDERSLF